MKINEPHEERDYEKVTFDSHKTNDRYQTIADLAKKDERDETEAMLRAKVEHLNQECKKLGRELQRERQKTRILGSVIIMQAVERKKIEEERLNDQD